MKTLIGKVTEKERDEIKLLVERRNSLLELKMITSSEAPIYDRLISDIKSNAIKYQLWWHNMIVKYDWKVSSKNINLRINFITCNIYLKESKL